MKRHNETSKTTTPASTLGASGLLGVGALLVAILLDRPKATGRRHW